MVFRSCEQSEARGVQVQHTIITNLAVLINLSDIVVFRKLTTIHLHEVGTLPCESTRSVYFVSI